MKDETVILLCRLKDYSGNRLAKYIAGNLEFNANHSLFYDKPLQEIFSKVIAYDFIERTLEIGPKAVNDEVLELVKKEHPKYVVWLSAMYEFQETTFDAIREQGAVMIGWFFDDEYRFAHYSQWWVPHLDYCVTFDREAVPKYRALMTKAIQEISCEGAPTERDWTKIEEKYDVSFVGWKSKSLREHYINEIRKSGISLSLFGRGWETGYVPYEKMIEIFQMSKINLNFSGTGDRKGLKARVSLVCLSGGFLLTEYVPGIEEYFELDKEIVCFKDAQEMIDKITYYLAHDEERRAVARAGWERANREYTPFHMLTRVFDKVEADLAAGGGRAHLPAKKMPLSVRLGPSQYYFQWGRAFLEEGYERLWRDALELSLAYNPYYIAARYYDFAGRLPAFLRVVLFKLYLILNGIGTLISKVFVRLLIWVNAVPYLGDLKRWVSRKLQYS